MSHTRHIDRPRRPYFLSRVSGPEGYSEGFRLAQKAPLFWKQEWRTYAFQPRSRPWTRGGLANPNPSSHETGRNFGPAPTQAVSLTLQRKAVGSCDSFLPMICISGYLHLTYYPRALCSRPSPLHYHHFHYEMPL